MLQNDIRPEPVPSSTFQLFADRKSSSDSSVESKLKRLEKKFHALQKKLMKLKLQLAGLKETTEKNNPTQNDEQSLKFNRTASDNKNSLISS